jgi:hypothetical protein
MDMREKDRAQERGRKGGREMKGRREGGRERDS